MPTVAELERLQALVDRLTPVGSKQRGELIEAADWNTLTGALTEVARVVLAEEREGVVAVHDHPDQVGVGWLEPTLRLLVERGPLADPAAVARVAAVERDLARLEELINRLSESIAAARTRVTDVATRDLNRASEMDRLSRRVDGVGDAREDVLELRETLRTLDGDLRRVTTVAARLEVDGEPIDARVLVDRIAAVERLRDAWTAADGTLVDAAEIERRLAEVDARSVTSEDLTIALEGVDVELDDAERRALLDAARVAARTEVAGAIDESSAELRGFVDQRLATVDRRIATAVADATGGMRDEILADAARRSDEIAAQRDQSLSAALRADLDTRVAETMRGVDAKFADFKRSLDTEIGRVVSANLEEFADTIDRRLTGLEDRVGRIGGRVDLADAQLRTLSTRVEVVRREALDTTAALRVDLDRKIGDISRPGTRPVVGGGGVGGGGAQPSDITPIVRAEVDAARRSLEARLAERVASEAATEVRLANASLDGRVREIVRDELAALRAHVDEAVGERTAALARRLPGLVSDEVRRATAGVGEVVRAELDTILPEVRRTVDIQLDARLGRG
jgi:hypothetical protein